MINELLSKSQIRASNRIARRKAKLQSDEQVFCESFMRGINSETMRKIFDVVEKNGHPIEQEDSKRIKNKYDANEELSFDDIVKLDALYKSNFNHMKNDI